jgi:hypothetical protein
MKLSPGQPLQQTIEVPLYYTGLTSTATITFEDEEETQQGPML